MFAPSLTWVSILAVSSWEEDAEKGLLKSKPVVHHIYACINAIVSCLLRRISDSDSTNSDNLEDLFQNLRIK